MRLSNFSCVWCISWLIQAGGPRLDPSVPHEPVMVLLDAILEKTYRECRRSSRRDVAGSNDRSGPGKESENETLSRSRAGNAGGKGPAGPIATPVAPVSPPIIAPVSQG